MSQKTQQFNPLVEKIARLRIQRSLDIAYACGCEDGLMKLLSTLEEIAENTEFVGICVIRDTISQMREEIADKRAQFYNQFSRATSFEKIFSRDDVSKSLNNFIGMDTRNNHTKNE